MTAKTGTDVDLTAPVTVNRLCHVLLAVAVATSTNSAVFRQQLAIVSLSCFFVVAVIVRSFFAELQVIVVTNFYVVRKVDKVRHCDVCTTLAMLDLLMARQNVTVASLVTVNVLEADCNTNKYNGIC